MIYRLIKTQTVYCRENSRKSINNAGVVINLSRNRNHYQNNSEHFIFEGKLLLPCKYELIFLFAEINMNEHQKGKNILCEMGDL